MKSCLLCGVGGQGTVLASRILAGAAMEQGLFARTAETIGMAQRGGCVVSHVRFGKTVFSPMIPLGTADLLIGFEPGEAVRNLPYLKGEGTVVVCDRTVWPVTAALSGADYDGEALLAYLQKTVRRCYVVNADQVEAACGGSRGLNVALVGAALKTGVLGLEPSCVEKALEARVRPEFLEKNRMALKRGAEMVIL